MADIVATNAAKQNLFTSAQYYSLIRALEETIAANVGLNPAMPIQTIVKLEPWPVSVVRAVLRPYIGGVWLSEAECVAFGAVSDAEYLHYERTMMGL